MRNIFQRIFNRVRIGVHRIDAPFVAGAMVMGMLDAVNGRIAQVDIGRGHIDFGTQDMCAFSMLARPHFAEQF